MKKFYAIVTTILVLLALWFVASWVDVIANNLDPNPSYQVWNMFEIAFGN